MTALSRLMVKYVSLPPGAGKTDAAIEMMKQHIQRALDLKHKPRYVFYVATTRHLLKQTAERLHKQLSTKERRRLRIAYSEEGSKDDDTVQEQVNNILAGRTNDGKKKQAWEEGCVLFMTHKAFLALSNHKDIIKDTVVLFDESRKWADMLGKVQLDAPAQEYFDRLFKTTPLKVGKEVYHGIHVLHARVFPENKKVSSLQGKKAAYAFRLLDELHQSILPDDDKIVRTQAYAFFEGDSENRRMIQVSLPSHPFSGFQDVYILSADFETSQMFHFLEMEGNTPTDASKWFMNKFSKEGYRVRLNEATSRYDYLTIAPLLADDRVPALGKYLNGGCILPLENLTLLGDYMKVNGISTKDLMTAIKRVKDPLKGKPSAAQRELVKLLHGWGGNTDMLGWLVARSTEVVAKWHKKHPCKHRALMFLNHKFRDEYDLDETFKQLNHGKAEGDNRFRDSNAVVFLPAINPNPHLARLLNALLGPFGYDADEDFIVDKSVQCIGRGNIRIPNIKKPMLAVVPTLGLASRLQRRYKGFPTLTTDAMDVFGCYQSWDFKTYTSIRAQARKKAEKELKPKRKIRPDEIKSKLKALNARAYRARQKGDEALAKEYEAEMESIRSQFK
ncbi:hypothetical protein [Burkholderia phage BCSR5]|nr:hypothetical protein [Burkholderia phage BCSR5]